MREGNKPATTWTYGEVLQRAVACAGRLAALDIGPGSRVLLLHPPGPGFLSAFLGCVIANVIPVPLPHPRQKRSLPRVRAVAGDCAPRLLWTDPDQVAALAALREDEPDLATMRLEGSDCGLADPALTGQRLADVEGSGPLFLQYTSGSTGSPKGVVVTHECLAHQFDALQRLGRHEPGWVEVTWLPHYHDMGLVGGLLRPISTCGEIVQMAPAHFFQDPAAWLALASQHGAYDILGPDFSFDLLTRVEHRTLDLSKLRVLWNGAEPIRAATLERFHAAFAPMGFRPEAWLPCYGMAECTLMATGLPRGESPTVLHLEPAALAQDRAVDCAGAAATTIVGSGRTMPGMRVAIVDPASSRPQPDDHVGEIWVQGGSVGAGYWGKEELSRASFGAHTHDGQGPFLRTGDLGFLRAGQLFVTGRLKDLIKVRGRNVYPQDLEEAVVAALPGTAANGVAAFALPGDGTEAIGIVVEGDRALLRIAQRAQRGEAAAQADLLARGRAVRQAVTDACDIAPSRIAFVGPGGFPRTTSGKVQRSLARQKLLDGSLEVVHQEAVGAAAGGAPVAGAGEALRERVAAAACQVLSRATGQPVLTVPFDAPLSGYGLDSLAAVELRTRLESVLGRPIEMESLRRARTLADLVDHLASLPPSAGPAPAPRVAVAAAATPAGGAAAAAATGPASRAVSITGLGVACGLGLSTAEVWPNLLHGRSASQRIAIPGQAPFVGVRVPLPPNAPGIGEPRAVQLALHAARQAWQQARYTGDMARVGVVVGTGLGNLDEWESLATAPAGLVIPREQAFRTFAHTTACRLASELDVRGPMQTVTTGCNSGADALLTAVLWLRAGLADAVLVGGTEAELVPSFVAAMTAAHGLSTRHLADPAAASRPFDRDRDGNVPGEGAAFLVLERSRAASARGAAVHGALLGVASLSAGRRPTYDPLDPPFDPEPLQRAMAAALQDAGRSPHDVALVHANGSSSVFYDVLEASAIAWLLGARSATVPVTSIKGGLGQTGAVSPVLMAVAAALSLAHGVVPPIANHRRTDPRVGLDLVVGHPRPLGDGVVLCNAIGFGGAYNASFVLGKA